MLEGSGRREGPTIFINVCVYEYSIFYRCRFFPFCVKSGSTHGNLQPHVAKTTGAICGPYDEGVGTRVCVDPWLLQPGEKKAKTPLIFSRLIFGRRGVNSFP